RRRRAAVLIGSGSARPRRRAGARERPLPRRLRLGRRPPHARRLPGERRGGAPLPPRPLSRAPRPLPRRPAAAARRRPHPPAGGGGAVAGGGADVDEAPGRHETMMSRPYVDAMAHSLRAGLDVAANEAAEAGLPVGLGRLDGPAPVR